MYFISILRYCTFTFQVHFASALNDNIWKFKIIKKYIYRNKGGNYYKTDKVITFSVCFENKNAKEKWVLFSIIIKFYTIIKNVLVYL